MAIRTAITGAGLALAITLVAPVAASASPSSTPAVTGAVQTQAAPAEAPPRAPAARTMIEVLEPEVTTTAWECPDGHSCFYDGYDGTNLIWTAPGPGFFNFGGMDPPLNDKVSSVRNLGGGSIDLYDWQETWVYKGTIAKGASGNLPAELDNIIDAVRIN